MKKTMVGIWLSTLTVSLLGADVNLLRNGGFEEGIVRWIGINKFVTEDGNKIGYIDANSSTQGFRQSFVAKQLKGILIKFKYRTSDDYKGGGFNVRIFRESETEDAWTWKNVGVKSKTEWKDFHWNYDDLKKDGQYYFEIKVKPGKGKIYFDDFALEPIDDSHVTSTTNDKPKNQKEEDTTY